MYGELKRGNSVTLDDGTIVNPEDVVGDKVKGKKLVVLGDTCQTTEIEEMSLNCDILIHEATMENSLEEKAIEYGHSTPEMAARFADKIKVRNLFYIADQQYNL